MPDMVSTGRGVSDRQFRGKRPGYLTRHVSYVTLSLSSRQLCKRNFWWDTAYRIIFHFNKWKNVKAFIHGLGRLNFIYTFFMSSVSFFIAVYSVCVFQCLNYLSWRHFAANYCKDSGLKSLFLSSCNTEDTSLRVC